MLSVYQRCLCLYPSTYRRQFGDEMLAVFQELNHDFQTRGPISRALFQLREIAGLMMGALREHLRALTIFDSSFLLSTRRFDMRNGFRFPKSTIVFMALILGGALTAIKKGQDIASSVPDINPPLPVHIQPVHSVLLGGMPLFFAFFYAAGLVGWAILFALRRSGVHRLDGIAGQK